MTPRGSSHARRVLPVSCLGKGRRKAGMNSQVATSNSKELVARQQSSLGVGSWEVFGLGGTCCAAGYNSARVEWPIKRPEQGQRLVERTGLQGELARVTPSGRKRRVRRHGFTQRRGGTRRTEKAAWFARYAPERRQAAFCVTATSDACPLCVSEPLRLCVKLCLCYLHCLEDPFAL